MGCINLVRIYAKKREKWEISGRQGKKTYSFRKCENGE